MNKKIVLGIETSCDDTSIAIIEKTDELKVLSLISYDQEASLKKWGGVVPEVAARNHLTKLPTLLDESFSELEYTIEDIDLIGVTVTPGLLGPLLTGLNCAKSLSLVYKKPILPVNHLYAHLEAIHIDQNISYPYLGLLVSGGHSIFFWVESKSSFKVIGSTIDDAAGEAFDKGANLLGLGYPGGQNIDKIAKLGDKRRFEFPIGLKSSADCRLSFSGLKTALRVFLDKNEFAPKSQDFYDLCASYQEAIVKALSLKMRYAIKKVKEEFNSSNFQIVVGGGVACNSALRSTLQDKYNDVYFVSPKYCTDNGAMIANYALINQDDALSYPTSLELDARGRFINKKDYL